MSEKKEDELRADLEQLGKTLRELFGAVNQVADEKAQELAATINSKKEQINENIKKVREDIRNAQLDPKMKEELQKKADDLSYSIKQQASAASESLNTQINTFYGNVLEAIASSTQQGSDALKRAAEEAKKKSEEYKK